MQIKKVLLFTSIAIAHDTDFREVQDWAVAPSSSRLPNQIMEELKEHVRWMMNGRKPAPIFIRHTGTSKSRFDGPQRQMDMNYCQKHFRSIRVNEAYRGKLRGRVVCVFDDYLTHGNTFEALRNLLVACGVKKIIFVSIGKFMRSNENAYAQKLFSIDGDVHRVNYNATFNGVVHHFVSIDIAAKRSLGDLRLLASYLQ